MDKNMFKRIVVPIDFSEISLLALEKAKFISKMWGAKLYLLHVYEGMFAGIDYPNTSNNLINILDIEKELNTKLTDFAENIKIESNIEAEATMEFGKVSTRIVEFSKDIKADLIVMGTHGADGIADYFLGSNAYRVVSDSPCPVITIPGRLNGLGFKRILLPIDSDFHSLQKLFPAIEIANKMMAKIHVLGEKSKYDDDNVIETKVKYVETKLKEHGVVYSSEMVDTNDISKTVIEKSIQMDSDLIIILSEHDNEFPGFMGNFAHKMVNHSKIPIMSIIPKYGAMEFETAGFAI